MAHVVVDTAVSIEKKIEEEAERLYKQFLSAKVAIEASAPYDLAHTILLRAGYGCPSKKQVMALRAYILDGLHASKEIVRTGGSKKHASVYSPKQ